jgi:hypothetical protein
VLILLINLKVSFLELVGAGDVELPHKPDEGRPGVARQPTCQDSYRSTLQLLKVFGQALLQIFFDGVGGWEENIK